MFDLAQKQRGGRAGWWRPQTWGFGLAVVVIATCLVLALERRGSASSDGNFEDQAAGSFPQNWVSTSNLPIIPATVSSPGAFGSKQSLLLRPSSPKLHRGASVWHALPAGDQPLEIDFSFAFGGKTQRAVQLWTSDQSAAAPTQLNLVIENRRLRQFHPLFHEWLDIGEELKESPDPEHPLWYRLKAVTAPNSNSVEFWLSSAGDRRLPPSPIATLPAYRSGHKLSRLHLVVERSHEDAFFRVDDLAVRTGQGVRAPSQAYAEESFDYHRLWSGPPIPASHDELPALDSVHHVLVHAPRDGQYTFLHGAAIIYHKGRFYANWANSPKDENSGGETLQGSTSTDGITWTKREMIARGPQNGLNYSHAAYLSFKGELWTFPARFHGVPDRGPQTVVRHPDLQVEALVLDEKTNRWVSRGVVGRDMWPYFEPIMLGNGNWITAGQDMYGGPAVMISRGDDLTSWRTVKIPVSDEMPKGIGETAILRIAGGKQVLALVRPGRSRVAWASLSSDSGETWTPTQRTNFPIGISKMYAGRLSTRQPYLVANFPSRGHTDRDTLAIAVGRPGEDVLRKIYEIRFGPPRPVYPGYAKGAQWSYPYAYEHQGKLYVVYSINKEDCGLSIIPIRVLTAE